jgi:elongation factor 1 alpha-like protein
MSASDFFKDTPWLNVPIHRRGDIFIEPLCPRGGLLGGSSKLAALAAARKRKQEEAKAASTPQNSGAADNAETDRAVALLDRLKVKDNPKDASAANSRPSEPSYTQKPGQMRHPPRRKKSPSPPLVQKEEDSMADPIQEPVAAVPDIRAPPSTFAATMFGALNPGIPVRSSEGSLFSIPLYRAKQPADNDPFAGPSPDDIVTNAQTKGSLCT